MAFPNDNYASAIRGFGGSASGAPSPVFVQPRPKYTWFAHFDVVEESRPSWYEDAVREGKMLAALASCGHPSVEFAVETLNSYNAVRHVPTKIKYRPVSVKMYDDTPSYVARLLKAYRDHYHFSGSAKSSGDFGDGLPGTASERAGDLPSVGMRVRNKRNFFREITIYDLGTAPGSINIYRLANPIVSSIAHGDLDYYDNTGMVEVNFTIEYEGFSEELGVPMAQHQEALVEIGGSAQDTTSGQLGLGDSGTAFGDFVDRLGVALPGILSDTFANSGFSLDALKRGLLGAAASGTPVQDLRNAARTVQLIAGAARVGNPVGAVGLLDRLGSLGFLGFKPGRSAKMPARLSGESAADLMRNLTIDSSAWIDLLE
jgi:hypothetical protein